VTPTPETGYVLNINVQNMKRFLEKMKNFSENSLMNSLILLDEFGIAVRCISKCVKRFKVKNIPFHREVKGVKGLVANCFVFIYVSFFLKKV
jgi:hypothetical protein